MALLHNLIQNFTDSFLEFISPSYCETCEKAINPKIDTHSYICKRCLDSAPFAPPPEQLILDLKRNFGEELFIRNCASLISIGENKDYEKPVYSLKYKGLFKIGLELGQLTGKYLLQIGFIDYDAIIPVPIHPARQRERGYNQADYIAHGISSLLNIPVDTRIIRRIKYTGTQTALSGSQRMINIKGKIGPVQGADVKSRRFLLVDDIMTTGSTLNECAYALISAGAGYVDTVTIEAA